MRIGKATFTLTAIILVSFLLAGCFGSSKEGFVIGTVVTKDGKPIPGVTIMIGSESQTSSEDGAFRIKTSHGTHNLVAKMAGITVATEKVRLNGDEVSVEVVVKPILLSDGKSYEYVALEPSENNPDPDGTKLTDGELGRETEYWHVGWVATRPDSPWSVVVDLGLSATVDSVRSNHLAGSAGIGWPQSVTVRVSDDSVNWSEPVVVDITEAVPGAGTGKWFGVDDVAKQGRYVEVTWGVREGGQHVWVSEIEVYGLPAVD